MVIFNHISVINRFNLRNISTITNQLKNNYMKSIGEKATDYAINEVKSSFEKLPDNTRRLLELLLKKAYLQGVEDSGKDVLIDKIEVIAELSKQ